MFEHLVRRLLFSVNGSMYVQGSVSSVQAICKSSQVFTLAGPFGITFSSVRCLRIGQKCVDGLGPFHSPLNLYMISIWNMLAQPQAQVSYAMGSPHFSTSKQNITSTNDAAGQSPLSTSNQMNPSDYGSKAAGTHSQPTWAEPSCSLGMGVLPVWDTKDSYPSYPKPSSFSSKYFQSVGCIWLIFRVLRNWMEG